MQTRANKQKTSDAPKAKPKPKPESTPAQNPLAHWQSGLGNRAVGQMLQGLSGEPLAAPVRSYFEPRLGKNLEGVRVHTDSASAQAAHTMHADAYTKGNDIVFGPGQYAPETREGRNLLAHELTHVAQQASGSAPQLQRQAKKTPPVFYQEVVDAIQGEEKTVVHLQHSDFGGWALPYLHSVLNLCKAVDAKDTKSVIAQVPAFVAQDPSTLMPYMQSEGLANELISRTFHLGLEKEAAALRRYFRRRERQASASSSALHDFRPDRNMFDQITDDALAAVKLTSKADASASLDELLRTFKLIRDEAGNLDKDALRRDRQAQQSSGGFDTFALAHDDGHSISGYRSHLEAMLARLAVPLFKAYQTLLDAGIADLEKGVGPANLNDARDALENRIKPILFLEVEGKYMGNLRVDVTRSEFARHGGRHLDYFLEGKAARDRSIGFTYYSRDQSEGAEKDLSLEQIFDIRLRQLGFLERLYGQQRQGGKVTEESQENADVIKRQKGMRLDNNDDWRNLAAGKFDAEVARGVSPGDALAAVIDLLGAYLHAFTMHSQFDIEEWGPNYLTHSFPRALTGQLLHDCGVYALRIAYILSLVREKPNLKLRFRFVRLPVHLGLVITGDNLPTFIAHNNEIQRIDPQQLKEQEEGWKSHDQQGQMRPKPVALDEPQFIGELASAYFIPKVDIPFRLEEVPEIKAKNLAALKDEYMRFYRAHTLRDVLQDDPKGGVADFQLEYLRLSMDYRDLYNGAIVGFWNVQAKAIWKRHGQGILDALAAVQTSKPGDDETKAQAVYAARVKALRSDLDQAFAPIDSGLKRIEDEKKEVSRILNSHPALLARYAKIAHSARTVQDYEWFIEYNKFLDELGNLTDLRKASKPARITPPFAAPKSILPQSD